MPVAVVTDSTAYLPSELSGTYDLTVVPLTVVINGDEGLEGLEISPADVAHALSQRRVTVSTSRPAPEQFVAAYRRLLDAGADGIVSVHLSSQLSGTYDAAVLAAGEVGPQVQVVDSGTTAMGLGFVALGAATEAAAGATLPAVRQAAVDHSAQVSTLF
jgi:DegV family protein with EDD domain